MDSVPLERSLEPAAPPFARDDLFDFHHLLETPDRFEQLRRLRWPV